MTFPAAIRLSALALLLSAKCACGITLPELEKSFESKCAEVLLEKDRSIQSLQESYMGALKRIQNKYQRAGRLDEVILVKEEIKAIEGNQWPLLALPDKISLETNAPRKIYLRKHLGIEKKAAENLVQVAETMVKALGNQVTELTKSGDLADAKLAQQIQSDINELPAISAARRLVKNVRSDGSSRPALRIRRSGDNIEALVSYDMRGKISLDSPIQNVEETDKSIGDTTASVLGEFVGAKGFEADPYVALEKVFDGTDISPGISEDIDTKFKHTEAGETGVRLSFKPGGDYPYIHLGRLLPIKENNGTTRITTSYFVPKSNKSLIGIHFKQGTYGGAALGGLTFHEQGEWKLADLNTVATSEQPDLLLYLDFTSDVIAQRSTTEYLVLKDIKVEQIQFTTFVVQRLGESGVINEDYKSPESQPKLTENGELIPE